CSSASELPRLPWPARGAQFCPAGYSGKCRRNLLKSGEYTLYPRMVGAAVGPPRPPTHCPPQPHPTVSSFLLWVRINSKTPSSVEETKSLEPCLSRRDGQGPNAVPVKSSASFPWTSKGVPCYSYGQKLSKLAILRIACNYILSLARLADLDYSADHSNMSFSECVEQCTRTLQAEGRSKKRKVCHSLPGKKQKKKKS
uniref:Atonal bHLH transcription factor 8 n=1 Tax=Dromaius novaehollandiae TaxID=8790 RepID=A0A8C4K3Z7_DRONO